MGPSVCLVSKAASASAVSAAVGLVASVSLNLGGEMIRSCPDTRVFWGLPFGWRALLGGTEMSISPRVAWPGAQGIEGRGGEQGGRACVPAGSQRRYRAVMGRYGSVRVGMDQYGSVRAGTGRASVPRAGTCRGLCAGCALCRACGNGRPRQRSGGKSTGVRVMSPVVTHSSLPKQPVLM